MKKAFTLIVALIVAVSAYAQTAQEIVERMDAAMAGHESEGMTMVMEMKMFLIGTVSTTIYSKGDKYRFDMDVKGNKVINWSDKQTDWTYDSTKNTITIKNNDGKKSNEQNNAEMFNGITEGYDVSIAKQTADAWYIKCRKSATNTNKDDPKKMDLVVSKENYYPLSLSADVSLVTVTMRLLGYGVTDEQVTFNPDNYPGATFIDER